MPFQKGNKLGRKFGGREKHWNYKGGYKFFTSGSGKKRYRRIKIGDKYIAEHRYIMEKHLKRKLKRSEIVHHRDGDGLNNEISNLEIISQTEHTRLIKSGSHL